VNTAEIIDQLERATTDLLWVSESDYPFTIVSWAKGTDIDPTGLFKNLTEPHLTIESSSLVDFFAPALVVADWYEAAELAIVARYQALLSTIESLLTDVKVFRSGRIFHGRDFATEIDVYIVGKTPDGDILGLKTTIVET
jgi:Nuclease A inhibitor-like protein